MADQPEIKKQIINEFSGNPLISQKYFDDFNWGFEWAAGDIIWMEDYRAVDFRKYNAAQFIKIKDNKVFIQPIGNITARRCDEAGLTNVNRKSV